MSAHYYDGAQLLFSRWTGPARMLGSSSCLPFRLYLQQHRIVIGLDEAIAGDQRMRPEQHSKR